MTLLGLGLVWLSGWMTRRIVEEARRDRRKQKLYMHP